MKPQTTAIERMRALDVEGGKLAEEVYDEKEAIRKALPVGAGEKARVAKLSGGQVVVVIFSHPYNVVVVTELEEFPE